MARACADASLVTLTGPGGAGKTRLAREAAALAAADPARYPDGVWWAELAPLAAGGAAAFAERLLRACPALTVLATSREALEGEVAWQVPPLARPVEDAPRADALLAYDAVRLFVARAAAVQPAFALTDAR